jgi:hypothetical protein
VTGGGRIRALLAARYPQLRRLALHAGFHLVPADHRSPIPSAWRPELWQNAADTPGVDLRLDAGVELLRRLSPSIVEYDPPAGPPGTRHGYWHQNGVYPRLDAEVLYAMVRDLKPRRVVEIGAGWSSKVFADALEPEPVESHLIYDPFPGENVATLPVERLRAEDIPSQVFDQLGAGDVLFIDTTHTVKPGNDVVRLELEVLPTLAPGVVVHVHDVFLPYCYPEFMFDAGAIWQEQYLVQALLAFTTRFEVLLSNYALTRLRPAEMEDAVPGISDHGPGSALWLRVLG